MRKLLIAAVVMLSGCAPLTPQQAANYPTYNLCRMASAPMAPDERRASAMDEVRRRGESCNVYAAMINQERETAFDSLAASTAKFQQLSQPVYVAPIPSPRVIQPPTRTTCRRVFDTVQCDTM